MDAVGREEAGATVAALAADLMFASRIRGAAAAVGVRVRIARRGSELLEWARAGEVHRVLVDLEIRSEDAVDLVRSLRREGGEALEIVAFGPHVAVDLLAAAREAGATRVMARSAFSRELPDLLKGSD
jgi:DNA-binding response OmpR family regulator